MEHDTPSLQPESCKPDFVAELRPHRSLGRTGFLVLMGFISFTCLLSGFLFLLAGAWPVFLFFGLDVLVIWAAFKLNYRAARARERVSVQREELKVERIDPAGRVVEHRFNPFWTRFEIDRHEEYGITAMWLSSRNTRLMIGSFLNPADRESFAFEFGNALSRLKA